MRRHPRLSRPRGPATGAPRSAIGNFDGVHLGHQSVLALARAAAAERGAPFGVVTFEPHPRSFFAPDAPPFRLMDADARARRLEKLGVEQLYELPLRRGASPALDAGGLRCARCWPAASACGTSWSAPTSASARARGGDAALLQALGPRLGFGVTVAPLVSDAQGDFSSTAIRAALSDGPPRGGGAHARPLAPHRGRGAARRQARPRPRLPHRQPLRSTSCTCRASASTPCWSTCSTGPHRGPLRAAPPRSAMRPTFGGEPRRISRSTCSTSTAISTAPSSRWRWSPSSGRSEVRRRRRAGRRRCARDVAEARARLAGRGPGLSRCSRPIA